MRFTLRCEDEDGEFRATREGSLEMIFCTEHLAEVLGMVDHFIRGCGFFPPQDTELQYVEEEPIAVGLLKDAIEGPSLRDTIEYEAGDDDLLASE